jgi:hypothetical protein
MAFTSKVATPHPIAAFFSSADGGGEFVVAGCKGSPLLEDVEAAFDDVAAFVVILVEGGSLPLREPRCFRWPIWSEGCGMKATMPRSRRWVRMALYEYGLVTANTVRARTWPARTDTVKLQQVHN